MTSDGGDKKSNKNYGNANLTPKDLQEKECICHAYRNASIIPELKRGIHYNGSASTSYKRESILLLKFCLIETRNRIETITKKRENIRLKFTMSLKCFLRQYGSKMTKEVTLNPILASLHTERYLQNKIFTKPKPTICLEH